VDVPARRPPEVLRLPIVKETLGTPTSGTAKFEVDGTGGWGGVPPKKSEDDDDGAGG
jgi:hypothetical protein